MVNYEYDNCYSTIGFLQGQFLWLVVGHLVLGQEFLGINQPSNSFEIIVHIGTLFSVLIFWSDIFLLLNFQTNNTHLNILFTLWLEHYLGNADSFSRIRFLC